MLGFIKNILSGPQPVSPEEQAWQKLRAINMALAFPTEPSLTDEQHKLAEACTAEFKLLFGGGQPYRYDLRSFRGPYLISPEQLDDERREVYHLHLDLSRKELNDPNYNVWLFEFRQGADVAHFFADTCNGAEMVFSTLEE
jgi:hypothetical protein